MKKISALCVSIIFICSTFASCGSSGDKKTVSDDISISETTLTTTTIAPETTTTAVETTSTENQTTAQEETPVYNENPSEDSELSIVQKNSVAWLNYLALLTQEINSAQNNRMYMEEAYSALINNTNPAKVNEPTESQLVSLLDIIEKNRLIAVKRKRLQCIYEQNKARGIRAAIPNPIALLSSATALSPKRFVASVLYMAIDSYENYKSYNNELDQEYLKDGWELDDEAAENLHASRKRAFTYMIDIVKEYDLPGELALNENAIKEFVDCKNNSNTHQQIQFLESNESTYRYFGNYWLLRAKCYYDDKNYSGCLECIDKYENLHQNIFRCDYELAKTLPLAITSAYEIYYTSKYADTAQRYLEMIMNNTNNDEWSLRYYCAETYADLYSKTNNTEFLKKAYNIVLNNVNSLVSKQEELNKAYISDIMPVSVPNDATDEEEDQIEDYNESLEEKRKTELPETYEPLVINCDLLFTLAEKLNISESEKNHIDNILSSVFLTRSIQNRFSFMKYDESIDAEYDDDELTLPVSCVSESATIKVTVTCDGEEFVFDDWIIDKVERPDSNSFSSFKATYESDKADDHKWKENSNIKVEVFNGDSNEPYVLRFVSKLDEGVLPSWAPGFLPGTDKIVFEQVK